MNAKKTLILILLFLVSGVSFAFGGSQWGEFRGFPKVKVNVNDSEVALSNVPGFIINESVVLPLRKMTENLHALVTYDSAANVVDIYKPNVHMFVGKEYLIDNKTKQFNGISQSFGKVQHGEKFKFFVFAQVDSLKANIESYKLEIRDPSGNYVDTPQEVVLEKGLSTFWNVSPFEVSFDSYGEYKVRFSMKPKGDDYQVVSEKVIVSE